LNKNQIKNFTNLKSKLKISNLNNYKKIYLHQTFNNYEIANQKLFWKWKLKVILKIWLIRKDECEWKKKKN